MLVIFFKLIVKITTESWDWEIPNGTIQFWLICLEFHGKHLIPEDFSFFSLGLFNILIYAKYNHPEIWN